MATPGEEFQAFIIDLLDTDVEAANRVTAYIHASVMALHERMEEQFHIPGVAAASASQEYLLLILSHDPKLAQKVQDMLSSQGKDTVAIEHIVDQEVEKIVREARALGEHIRSGATQEGEIT